MKRYIKKLLRESLIREDDDIKQKLMSLLNTGDKDNIELAYAIGGGQGINVDELVKSEYGDLLEFIKGSSIKEKVPGSIKMAKYFDSKKDSDSLNLEYGEWYVLPERIGRLTNLKTLRLNNNNLESLPDWIGNLTNLKSLRLGGNGLKSLPESIGNLTNLEYLDLSNNNLETLPDSIGNLKNLKELDVRYNYFFNDLERLEELLPNTDILSGPDDDEYF